MRCDYDGGTLFATQFVTQNFAFENRFGEQLAYQNAKEEYERIGLDV